MWKRSWTWTAALSAALVAAGAAVLIAGAGPARSEDGDDVVHIPPSDFAFAIDAQANWESESERETALAAYLGAGSREETFAPLEDPSYLDTH